MKQSSPKERCRPAGADHTESRKPPVEGTDVKPLSPSGYRAFLHGNLPGFCACYAAFFLLLVFLYFTVVSFEDLRPADAGRNVGARRVEARDGGPAWSVYPMEGWHVEKVGLSADGWERTCFEWGCTGVRDVVHLADSPLRAVQPLEPTPLVVAGERVALVGYQSPWRGESLGEDGRPLRWQKDSTRGADLAQMETRLPSSGKRLYPYVVVTRGLGFKGPMLRHADTVVRCARRYRIPAHLLFAVMQVESGGRHDVVSPREAVGLMQVQPSTAGTEVHSYLVRRYGVPVPPVSGTQGLGNAVDTAQAMKDGAGSAAGSGSENAVPTWASKSPVHAVLAREEQNILYGAVYLHLLADSHFRRVSDPEARQLCVITAYNIGPGRFLRLFDEDRNRALAEVNRYTPTGLYHEIKVRLGEEGVSSYMDKVITLMLQYRRLGY